VIAICIEEYLALVCQKLLQEDRGRCYCDKVCPEKGEKLTVYYEKENPARYAVII
jgi:hypothetical protein